MDIEVLCMKRADTRIDVFLVKTSKKPEDPITELKEYYPGREYIDGYYLSDVSIDAVNSVIRCWKAYDSSLMGVWHHPSFPDILDDIKRASDFRFDVPGWCYSELKNPAYISYLTTLR